MFLNLVYKYTQILKLCSVQSIIFNSSQLTDSASTVPHFSINILAVLSQQDLCSGIGTIAAVAAMTTALFASFQRPKVIFTCRHLYYIITSRLTPCTKIAYNSLL